MIFKALLFLSFAVAGLVADPAERYSYNMASGFGPDGSKVETGPNGVFVSGPGYYAGSTSFSSGASPTFPKFPVFPAFPAFPSYPFAYAAQYPFNTMQAYFNTLAQNAAAIAQSARPYQSNKPIKYTAKPYNTFAFPSFPSQPPFSGSGSFSSSSSSSSSSGFGNPLENRFGEQSSSSTVNQGSKPGFVGVFSSTSHGTSNVNGKEESFHVATTGVNENGKVTSVTVHKP